jgi:cytoskeletal protein RodZ
MAGREVAPGTRPGAEPGGLPGGEQSDTLGGALRRARRERGLTIQQIAATTRIPARHLEALERDDINVVPGGVYLRAEVRTFADAVGLNRNIALNYLDAALDPPVVSKVVAQPPSLRASRRIAAWGAAVLAGASLVVAAIVLWPAGDARHTASIPAASGDRGTAADQPVTAAASGDGATAGNSDAAPAVTFDPAAPAATSGTRELPPSVAASDTAAATEHPPAAAVPVPVLEIVTQPAGARVTIDGIGWGVTPVTIRYLPPGTKQLRVTRDGFATEQRVIRFAADQPRTSVRIDLQPAR